MHKSWTELLKGRESPEAILAALLIKDPNAEAGPKTSKAVTECLKLMDSGSSLEQAADQVLKSMTKKDSTSLAKKEESSLAQISEPVEFDGDIRQYLEDKVNELTAPYDPEIALTGIIEGMLARSNELNKGMDSEQIREVYRKIGMEKIDRKAQEMAERGIPLATAQRIYDELSRKQ